jgi:hypothetical protein
LRKCTGAKGAFFCASLISFLKWPPHTVTPQLLGRPLGQGVN